MQPSLKERIQSIDIVRGLVMVIMAIDHVRDLTGNTTITTNPTNLQTTTIGLFLTRWITHLCAPTFVFLSGTSAFLSMSRDQDIAKARGFLLKRGLWLVFVNFTINNFAIFFDIHFGVLFSQVIAAIGFGFIGLALLLKLPVKIIGIIGLVILFGHNLFDNVKLPEGSWEQVLFTIFMNQGGFQLSADRLFVTTYPIIPWLGVMLLGYAFGAFFRYPVEKRKILFARIGLAALMVFGIIRAINIYGDPFKWAVKKNGIFTILSFINTTKYPPSLLFILMTVGISILFISLFERWTNWITDIIKVYGKVPLFFWLLHWFVIHFFAIGLFFVQGYRWSDLHFTGFEMGHPEKGGGLNIPQLYLLWIIIVILLYPVCKAYSKFKSAHPEKEWVRYL